MKFGFPLPYWPNEDETDRVDAMYRAAELAEEVGYDFVTVPNHRFIDGYPSAPLVELAAIAARTSHIKLATNILLLPLHHPLEIAEQVATLDVISRGRAILGVALGYIPEQALALGIHLEDRVARMTESLEVLPQLWMDDKVSFEGQHFSFRNVEIFPKPVQQPHPPVWVGAQKPKAIRRAAALANGWISGFQETITDLEPMAQIYRDELAAQGRSGEIIAMRHVGVGESREEVERAWLRPTFDNFRMYWQMAEQARGADPDWEPTMEAFAADRVVWGTPDDCVATIQDMQVRIGLDTLVVCPSHDRPLDLDRIRLFGREVISAFPGAGTPSGAGAAA